MLDKRVEDVIGGAPLRSGPSHAARRAAVLRLVSERSYSQRRACRLTEDQDFLLERLACQWPDLCLGLPGLKYFPRLTASSLNSRVNRRRSISHLRLHQNT